ncbi:MAG: 4'-phosphopantetheinyl transferase superfamily protein [Agarilytica sp.]
MSDFSLYSPFCKGISIESLPDFPSVLLGSAKFSQVAYDDNLFSDYGITRPESLKKAVVKRKSEFLAGRVLSSLVLRELGVSETEILIGKHRNPLWPRGTLGSISHAGDTVLAAVTLDETVSAIGIDIEEVMDAETASNIHGSIVNEEELMLMEEIGIPFEQMLTLVFSAKESFFKAAYPSVGEYFDFDAVRLIKCDLKLQSFSFRVVRRLSSSFECNQVVCGHFSGLPSSLVTHIVL